MKNDRMMKHMTLLLTLGLLLWGAQVQAQDWKDALKKVVTSAADEATGGKLTEVAIATPVRASSSRARTSPASWAAQPSNRPSPSSL